ncbi:hypothetical protein [Tsukamurella sp. 1534]|uniref:hypothetical protein n=1 Tax=Tsukamurella sp. 1534 TaxID=1151061 RepID=UPI0002ECAEE3|nr:hypothetical protein [Tsukamurella sp. 1534]
MAQTAAQQAVGVLVSAVEARGGKAEVETKGSTTLVTVTANGKTTVLRVKATTGDSWQARKSEGTAKAPVTAWALVDLSDGAPIALVSAEDYAAHVTKLAAAWEGKNPGKTLTANTNLTVTADAVAEWEDAWALLGLDGAGTSGPAAKAAEKPAAKPAEKKPAAAAKAPAKKSPAKKAPAKSAATKAPAKKAPAKTAAKSEAKPAAKSTTAKPATKAAPAKKAAAKKPVKASEAKITPIAAQRDAADQGKAPATIGNGSAKPAKDAPKAKPGSGAKADTKAKDAKAPAKDAKAASSQAAAKAKDAKDAAKSAGTNGQSKKSKSEPTGLAAVLKRVPVVGRLI